MLFLFDAYFISAGAVLFAKRAPAVVQKLGRKCQSLDQGRTLLDHFLYPHYFIQGGDAVWGNSTHAPEDEKDNSHSHGELIAFRRCVHAEDTGNMTADQAGQWILGHTPSSFQVGSEFWFVRLFYKDLEHDCYELFVRVRERRGGTEEE
jgi:hypothetical protein